MARSRFIKSCGICDDPGACQACGTCFRGRQDRCVVQDGLPVDSLFQVDPQLELFSQQEGPGR